MKNLVVRFLCPLSVFCLMLTGQAQASSSTFDIINNTNQGVVAWPSDSTITQEGEFIVSNTSQLSQTCPTSNCDSKMSACWVNPQNANACTSNVVSCRLQDPGSVFELSSSASGRLQAECYAASSK